MLAVLFVLVVVGPIISVWLSGRSLEWERLGQVGESYGGLSAVLSGIALIAVAGSLLLQWRQARANTVHAIRQRHFELVKLAIEHPSVAMELWGHTEADVKVRLYSNLQMVHWAMLADLESASLTIIRTSAARLFGNPAARKWWSSARTSWLNDTSERVRLMAETVDEEYEQAVVKDADPREMSAPPRSSAEARSSRKSTVIVASAVGAIAATAVVRHLAYRRRAPR